MAALDTNVLVRYVVQDDIGQLAAAKRLIDRCVAEGRSLFVPVTVTLELEWVLRASFGYAKDDVLRVLSNLFSAAELTFESERALEVALQLYREGSADFAGEASSAFFILAIAFTTIKITNATMTKSNTL